jgi:DNA end-binding protein Ku
MAARSIWNGTISFGLMSVPVKLHTATESKTVHFREVHLDDGAKIEHRRFCSKEDKEVPYKEVVKGYEVAPDEYVEKTYYLGAGKDGAQPYRVLLDALEQTGRAGIGRFTFHDREYLTAIRARDGVLLLHTLRFADELVPGKDIDVAAPSRGPGDREVKMAAQLIDTLHERFKADRYEDEYRAAVLDVVEAKAKGEAVAPDDEPAADDSADLMAALKASLDGAKKGGR